MPLGRTRHTDLYGMVVKVLLAYQHRQSSNAKPNASGRLGREKVHYRALLVHKAVTLTSGLCPLLCGSVRTWLVVLCRIPPVTELVLELNVDFHL